MKASLIVHAGAVAAVQGIRNPISVARRALGSDNVFLVGPGAWLFAREMVVGPRLQVHSFMEEETKGYVIAQVDHDEIRKYREELQIIQCRQPSGYRAVVRKY